MNTIYLDTETSGLRPGQIGQLAMIIVNDETGAIEAKNYFFAINEMEDGAMKVCHRNPEFYAQASGGRTFADYKDEIYNILSSGCLVAHNESFDENFLSTELWRAGLLLKPVARFDTMGYFCDIMKLPSRTKKAKYKNPNLTELVNFNNIDPLKIEKYTGKLFGLTDNLMFHDAMYDTTAMFVSCMVYKDKNVAANGWSSIFCN